MPLKRGPTVPDIEVAENQTAAPTLDAILAGFEDRILAILTTHLDPIVAALDAHIACLDAQAARFDAQQDIFNHLTIRLDDRSSPGPSEDLDDPIPTVG